MTKTAIAIRHIAFEDLGAFEPILRQSGYAVRYLDAGVDDLGAFDQASADLLVVLGAPIGAYEDDLYPFLSDEIRLLESRLGRGFPTLGICLGSQLMARALGSRVYPGPAKEIGFAPLTFTAEGEASALAAFAGHPVLHWHGDTFDLPEGAVRLASTDICTNQAFSFGASALAAQFHPEAGGPGFERWLIGHSVELAQAGIDIPALRAENSRLAPQLRQQATVFLERWLTEALSEDDIYPKVKAKA
ncbi:MAG TPA: glutamine amidotransferase [Sphingobium sp.]|uniref:glutamine amidotransferase n=1 Tax=Sphingobium sp. TaxID=1912891 RepID=UPI002ED535B5